MPLHWDRIPKVVEKYASVYVSLTLIYAFIAGASASIIVFRERFVPPRTLNAIRWICLPSALICTLLFGYILGRVLSELARLAQYEKRTVSSR